MLPVDCSGFDGLIEADLHVTVPFFSVVVYVRAEEGPRYSVELKIIQLHAINL